MNLNDLRKESQYPVIFADGFGVVISINEAFTNQFGWTSGELVGEPLATIIPEVLRDAHNLGFSRFLSTGEPTLMERPLNLKMLKANGDIVNAEHFIVGEKSESAWTFGARIRIVAETQ